MRGGGERGRACKGWTAGTLSWLWLGGGEAGCEARVGGC